MPPTRRLTRQQIYRRRRIAALVVLVLTLGLASLAVYIPTASAADLPDAEPVLETPVVPSGTPVEADFPGYGRGAIGAVGFDGLLASSGEQTQVPIASITKVVTALVVLSERPLAEGEQGPDIAFTSADIDIYYDVLAENGSLQPVRAGLVLSQRQVLETTLIPSANNYAESLAVWAFGSVDAYLGAARAWLDSNGLTDTAVVDTNGLSPGNVSTPADLVDLGKLALSEPVVASIVAMPSGSVPYVGEFANTNKLLGIGGVDGIKTGTTDEAGACLLFSTDVVVGSRSVTVVGVVLGADTHPELNEDVLALLESVTPGFREVTLTTQGEDLGDYSTAWDQEADIVAAETRTALVYSDEPITVTAAARPLEAGVAGEQVGSLVFDVGGELVEVPLVLGEAIQTADLWWRLSNPPWSR